MMGLAVLLPTAALPMVGARPVRSLVSVSYGPVRTSIAPHVSRTVVSRARVRPLPAPMYLGHDGAHVTVPRVRRYLARRGSPLAAHADAIVRAGIRYGMDPRTTVAVAGVETSFGLMTRHYNAWGWDPGRVRWRSWDESIWAWTRSAAASYRSLRAGNFWAAGPRYNPTTTWPHWAASATELFRSI